MAQRTKARTVTFGRTGGDYLVSNIRCEVPGNLRLTITHDGRASEISTHFTGALYSLAVGAAFTCTHQLGVPPAVIVERIASFSPVFARCSVHRVPNGPVFINDTAKAPYHSIYLTLDMLAGFQAPRKRIVIGNISHSSGSNEIYKRVYRAARDVAQQVIFIGEHSHRSKATPEEIAAGRFAGFKAVEEVANFLKETAIPGEIILLKGAHNLHLERLMLTFFTPVRCWIDACGKKSHCILQDKKGCGLYGVPFEQHKNARRDLALQLPDMHFG